MPDTDKRMDRAEIAKRVERAEKLLQKGKTADALDEYLQVLAEDPSNDNVRQMAADLCLSLQRTAEAVKLLGELFERQIEAGDNTRASLTYKKLARFVNPTWDQKVRFGADSRDLEPQAGAGNLRKCPGRSDQAGTQAGLPCMVLKRIVALDPREKNLLRLGELSSETGDSKSAAAAFLKLAEMTQAAGGDAAQWFERAYAEDPSDPQIALGYGKSLLEQGQVGAAIFVLEALVKAGPPAQETRETYAKALLAANRLTDAEAACLAVVRRESVAAAQRSRT